MIDYQLIRSKRRTLSICVDQEGALVVRAPLRMKLGDIEAFIEQKKGWIEEKQLQAQGRKIFRMQEGAQMPFWGGWLTIRLVDGVKVSEGPDELFLPRNGEMEKLVKTWRMKRAKELIGPLAQEWMSRTGIECSKISFGNAKSRWGSMNHEGHMRLNAALVHCPQALCEYVIVHELCHRLHADHSKAFHACVRSFLPDADARRRALKDYAGFTRLFERK